jgi:hypothetical protein
VAKFVARLLATAALYSVGSNLDISQNYKMGDIRKGVANTLALQVPSMLGSFEFENVRWKLKIVLDSSWKSLRRKTKMESLKFNIC